MSANVPIRGDARQLDLKAEPPFPLTEKDVQQPSVLVRVLRSLTLTVDAMRRRWNPRRIDFEDRTVLGDGTTKYRFEHRYGGKVRYWVVEWSGAAAPNLRKHTDSDGNTLVLTSTSAGTATIRVEEAGA